jgi:hypothetical protein
MIAPQAVAMWSRGRAKEKSPGKRTRYPKVKSAVAKIRGKSIEEIL